MRDVLRDVGILLGSLATAFVVFLIDLAIKGLAFLVYGLVCFAIYKAVARAMGLSFPSIFG